MPRLVMPARAGRWSYGWVLVSLVLLVPGAVRAAGRAPQVYGTYGGTFQVLGEPGDGGSSVSLAVLWPVTERIAFGAMAHVDDAGTTVGYLGGPQGPLASYGQVQQAHRQSTGASWRLDATSRPRFGMTGVASATWGYYRVTDDLRGAKLSQVGSTGFSLGLGVREGIGRHFTLGLLGRYHRLFNDREGRFMSAGLELGWR